MRLNVKLSKVLILIILFINSLSQAVEKAEKSLSWNDCVKLTVENNFSIKSAELNYKALKEQEDIAGTGYLPEVNATLSMAKSYNEQSSSVAQNSSSGMLSVSQNLFAGFLDQNKIKEAQTKTSSALIDLKLTKIKISADLKQAYSLYFYAFELTQLAKKIQDRRKDNLKIVELRYSSGRENKGSVLLSEAYYQQSQYDLLQAEELLTNYKSNLYAIIGIREPEEKLAPEFIGINKAYLVRVNFKDLVSTSLDFQQATLQQELARITTQKYKSTYYPSLVVSGSVGMYDEQFPLNYDKWSLGLSLTFPLYSGGKDSAQYRSSLEQWKSEQLKTKSAELSIEAQAKGVYSQYILSIEKLKVDEKFELAARLRSQVAKQKYNNGLMSFEDWDTVENDLIQREKNVLSSQKEILINESSWEKIKGTGVLL